MPITSIFIIVCLVYIFPCNPLLCRTSLTHNSFVFSSIFSLVSMLFFSSFFWAQKIYVFSFLWIYHTQCCWIFQIGTFLLPLFFSLFFTVLIVIMIVFWESCTGEKSYSVLILILVRLCEKGIFYMLTYCLVMAWIG